MWRVRASAAEPRSSGGANRCVLIGAAIRRALALGCAYCAALLAWASGAAGYDSGRITAGNPLAGHPWFVDRQWGPLWMQVRAWQSGHPGWAARLQLLAREPTTKSFGAFEPNPR